MTVIRALLSAIRCSVKRRDLYEITEKQLGLTVSLPSLDVETRWSSTFTMICSAHKAHPIFNSITARNNNLRQYAVSETHWHTSWTIAHFLQTAASLTDCQPGPRYATLSMTIRAFNVLKSKCKTVIDSGDQILKPIAEKMITKLDKYGSLLGSPVATLAKILDPRFGNDIISCSNILQKYVDIPTDERESTVSHNSDVGDSSGSNFLKML